MTVMYKHFADVPPWSNISFILMMRPKWMTDSADHLTLGSNLISIVTVTWILMYQLPLFLVNYPPYFYCSSPATPSPKIETACNCIDFFSNDSTGNRIERLPLLILLQKFFRSSKRSSQYTAFPGMRSKISYAVVFGYTIFHICYTDTFALFAGIETNPIIRDDQFYGLPVSEQFY